jgi:hypothetical protein
VVYKLDLPPTSPIHPVFHVTCLKAKLGTRITPLSTLPPVYLHGKVQLELAEVLSRCMVQKRGRAVTKVFVRWQGPSIEDDS